MDVEYETIETSKIENSLYDKISKKSNGIKMLKLIEEQRKFTMNELKFDKIVKSNLEDITTIEYGIIEGNNTIVFIKSGQNGSIYGYNNKYIKMAKRLNKKYKCTVICSSNPFDGNNPLDNAFTVIEKYTSKFEDYKVYYLGF